MKKRFQPRLEHFVAAGGVALILSGILLFGQKPRGLGHDPKEERQGSTRFTTPGGGKAFHALLRELGFPVRRHERAIELAPREMRALFLLSPSRPLGKEEAAGAARWVEKGHTLVWCPRKKEEPSRSAPLLAAFGLQAEAAEAGEENSEVSATLAPLGGPAGTTYRLAVPREIRLRAAEGSTARPLAADRHGWVAAVVPRGEGRFVALADARAASNAGLRRAGGAEFMVHLAALAAEGGTIGFDEFHHGFAGGRSALAIVWDSPLGPALVIVLAAAFAGLLSSGRRLGPPVDLHEERRRRPAEFVEAFAGLCRRMGATSQAASMVAAEFQLFLQRRLGLAAPKAAGTLAARAGLAPDAAARALDRARRAAGGAAFLASCREIENVRRALLGASSRRKE